MFHNLHYPPIYLINQLPYPPIYLINQLPYPPIYLVNQLPYPPIYLIHLSTISTQLPHPRGVYFDGQSFQLVYPPYYLTIVASYLPTLSPFCLQIHHPSSLATFPIYYKLSPTQVPYPPNRLPRTHNYPLLTWFNHTHMHLYLHYTLESVKNYFPMKFCKETDLK